MMFGAVRCSRLPALMLLLHAQPASADISECAQAESLFQLRLIYTAMIARPESLAVREVAGSAGIYARRLAEQAPDHAEALADLQSLADDLQASGLTRPLDDDARRLHMARAVTLTSPAAVKCEQEKMRPPAGGGVPPGGLRMPEYEDETRHLWLPIDDAARRAAGGFFAVMRRVLDPLFLLAIGTVGASGAGMWYLYPRVRRLLARRGHVRHPLRRAAELVDVATGTTWPAATVDIAASGLKLAVANGPSSRTDVRVRFAGRDIGARVVWSNAHFCGLQFDTVLVENEVADLRSVDAVQSGSGPATDTGTTTAPA